MFIMVSGIETKYKKASSGPYMHHAMCKQAAIAAGDIQI